MSTVKNYRKLSEKHFVWDSPATFFATPAQDIQDGVHTVHLGSVEVEFFFSGLPLASEQKSIPVFFNGAIMGRDQLEPPFFSGGGVAKSAGTPFIAVSDPVVDSRDRVNIAWYAGRAGEDLQSRLADFFTEISCNFKKELLFVGASAGGFAALFYSWKVAVGGGQSSVFAWNPQTDITFYVPQFAQGYLREAGVSEVALAASQWRELAKGELAGQVQLTLPASGQLRLLRKVLVLQNRTDWHLEKHMLPWLNTDLWRSQQADGLDVYVADEDHMVAVVDYAQGHDPIPPMIISFLLEEMLYSEQPVLHLLQGSDDV